MKYSDRDNGKVIELNNIIGCAYWENSSGEIYAVDRSRGYAWPVNPSMALKSVLARQNERNEVDHLNDLERILGQNKANEQQEGEAIFKSHQGHEENYLRNYGK